MKSRSGFHSTEKLARLLTFPFHFKELQETPREQQQSSYGTFSSEDMQVRLLLFIFHLATE